LPSSIAEPAIVPIFEIGQAESQHYFSMAFVEGESLAHRVVREVAVDDPGVQDVGRRAAGRSTRRTTSARSTASRRS
jgi:hypothetical protein